MEAALDAYEQAIQFVPREASFYYHKGHILEQLGRLAEAKCAYEQAKRLGYNG
jgi:Flp pilus assembly protein TadD